MCPFTNKIVILHEKGGPMRALSRFSGIAAVAFVATMSLVACDDSSSASDEEVPASSAVPGSSASMPESSVSVPSSKCTAELEGTIQALWEGSPSSGYAVRYLCENGTWVLHSQGPLEWKDPSLPDTKCTAENEGSVETGERGDPKYGYSYYYYQCSEGDWKEVEPWVACDTAGVTVGDTCKKVSDEKGFFSYGHGGEIVEVVFIYAGNGVWEYANPSLDPKDTCSFPDRECAYSNEFEIDSSLTSLKSSRTCYALCHDKAWQTLDAFDVPVYASCGAPEVGKNLQCCYTSPAEIVEQYPWNVSSLYEYTQENGWRLSEYFEVPDCGAAAE